MPKKPVRPKPKPKPNDKFIWRPGDITIHKKGK